MRSSVWRGTRPSARGSAPTPAAPARTYDIDLFVRKMERLYVLLHETSRATHRKGLLGADLSFLTSRAASS